jgi:hypothetical protein
MTAETHSDPFQDAMGSGLQRAMQVASCAVTAAQVYAYQHRSQAMAAAERDQRARRALTAQIRAERDVARAGWAPALDPDWLAQADIFQAARAWGQAMPYADPNVPWYEPAAGMALRRCEERLRDLHPFAMARYDRLRGDGFGEAEAMREAAPLFARSPHAREGDYKSRFALEPGTGESVIRPMAATPPAPERSMALPAALERRGIQILGALQARARAEHRRPLGEAEQRTVLETITNLPPNIIDWIVQPASPPGLPSSSALTTAGTSTASSDLLRTRPAARPWEHDFPVPIETVVANASQSTAQSPATPQARGRRRTQDSRPQSRPAPRHRKPK